MRLWLVLNAFMFALFMVFETTRSISLGSTLMTLMSWIFFLVSFNVSLHNFFEFQNIYQKDYTDIVHNTTKFSHYHSMLALNDFMFAFFMAFEITRSYGLVFTLLTWMIFCLMCTYLSWFFIRFVVPNCYCKVNTDILCLCGYLVCDILVYPYENFFYKIGDNTNNL